ncbi:hypothetical protein RFI_14247 [Reticulomyxa filosa]|uniref:Calponin-homology (CH) domain-containing protein n=1 Tax=Reticulomyxa filosa TaxID=46433 RepID=X6NAB5_RETFI|nr:hypothetical protein RFI_14247 [Reticulomyxa filosa]|eukprot:ETO22946.1 hypothetical protein RFI_14247 [Reticulomyxa filosa]
MYTAQIVQRMMLLSASSLIRLTVVQKTMRFEKKKVIFDAMKIFYNPKKSKMAQEPLKAGLAKETYDKQMSKFDKVKEEAVCEWANAVLGESLTADIVVQWTGGPSHFAGNFRDGKILVRLINTISPGCLKDKDMNLKSNLVNETIFTARIEKFPKFGENCVITEIDLASGRDVVGPLDRIYLFGVMCQQHSIENAKGGIKPKANVGKSF